MHNVLRMPHDMAQMVQNDNILMGMTVEHTDKEQRLFISQCKKGIPLDRYDTIQVAKEEGLAMVDAFEKSDTGAFELLTRPALPYFTGIFDESDMSNQIVFAPSVLRKSVGIKNGVRFISTPKIDAYVYQSRKDGAPDAVIVLSALKFNMDGKNEYFHATTHQVCFTNLDSPIGCSIDEHMQMIAARRYEQSSNNSISDSPLVNWTRIIKQIYLAIQYTLTNRPTVFKERVERREVSTGTKDKRGNIRRKVKTCRFITVNADEFQKTSASDASDKERRAFSCPSWGVIGHTRRLKSGKQVWVKPHTKGRERGKADNYSAKEYKIVQGEAASGHPGTVQNVAASG